MFVVKKNDVQLLKIIDKLKRNKTNQNSFTKMVDILNIVCPYVRQFQRQEEINLVWKVQHILFLECKLSPTTLIRDPLLQ